MTGRRWTGPAQATVIVAAAAIAALLALGGHPSAANAVAYQTTPVQVTTVTDQITAGGTVTAQVTLALSFGASTMPVTSVRVGVGAHVRAGQVLATVDSTAAEQQLAVAQAQLTAASVAATATAAPVVAAAGGGAGPGAAAGATSAQGSAGGGRASGGGGGQSANTLAPGCATSSASTPATGRPSAPATPMPPHSTGAVSATPSPTAPTATVAPTGSPDVTATAAPPATATPPDVSPPNPGLPSVTAAARSRAFAGDSSSASGPAFPGAAGMGSPATTMTPSGQPSTAAAPTPADATASSSTTATVSAAGSPSQTSRSPMLTSSAPAPSGSARPHGPAASRCATAGGPHAARTGASSAAARVPSGTGGRAAAGSGSTGGGAVGGAAATGGSAGSVTSAQQQVNDAAAAVAATRLVAPQDGVILSENLLPGTLPGTPAITMRADGYHVVVEIAEQDAPYVRVGQHGQVGFPALATTTAATVVQAPIAATPAAPGSTVVSFPVVFAVTAPPPQLLPGMSATLTLGVSSQPHVLAVPTTAVQNADAGYVVRVLVDGQPVTRPVRLGLSTPSLTQIVAGLAEGDQVITGTTT